MKLSNYIILFLSLMIIFFLPLHCQSKILVNAQKKQLMYNRALDNAVMDGLFQLVEKDSSREIVLNKEKAVNHFLESLYCNFGLLTNSLDKKRLQQYIPLIVMTDKDGYYLYISKLKINQNGTKILIKEWTKKQPYSISIDGFIYEFTLGNELKLYDSKKHLIMQGDFHEFAGKFPDNNILNHPSIFEETRRKCIIEHLKGAMRNGIEKHNNIIKRFGVNYEFFFPIIAKEDWYRTIDDISLIAIIQGYPWKENAGYFSKGSFSHYAIGGARAWKSTPYFVSCENEEGEFFYHRENCSSRTKQELIYWSKKECAKIGAYPCKTCLP